MRKSRKLTNLAMVLNLSITTALSGCNSTSSGTAASGSGSDTTTTPTVSGPTSSISGKVTSLAGGQSSLHMVIPNSSSRRMSQGPVERVLTNSCSSGDYSASYIGEGGTVVAAGSFSSGSFTIPSIPVGKELVVTFTCSGGGTQRCLAKSGDAGISCDPVADAVIAAFETALTLPITNAAFKGKSIAKVASAIDQAAQNDSTATDAFNTQILACQGNANPAQCNTNAINASPFAGAFKMMQTLAQGWTVEGLFTLMVDVYGANVGVDGFIYSPFATSMDTWLSTDFVANTRTFIANVVADQLAGGNTYVTKIECDMYYSKYQSGGQFKYSPVMKLNSDNIMAPSCDNTTAFTANGLSGTQIAAIETAMSSNNHSMVQLGTVACNAPNPWNQPGYYCISTPDMQIVSKYSEPNRNDPLGEHGSDYVNVPRVNMINTFSELDTALQNIGSSAPAGCISPPPGNDGPPVVASDAACQTFFGNFMASQKKNFAGLMGLYFYLQDPSSYGNGSSSNLSLKQLHQIFTQTDYLGAALGSTGMNSCGVQVSGGNGNYLNSLLSFQNGIFTQQADFANSCGMGGSSSITLSQAQADLTAALPPYSADFQMFENIPDANGIHNFVFGSAYHTDWNPTGSKLYYAASVKNTGIPIFCKMTDKDTGAPKEAQLDQHTLITCLSDTSSLTAPNATTKAVTIPDGYPYTLMNWGYQGDGKGSLFALADAKTGMQVRASGGPVLIYQIAAGNGSACSNTGTDTDKVESAILNMGWGASTASQSTPVYCMDFTNLANSGQFQMYNGGQYTMHGFDQNGLPTTWQMPEVGARSVSSTAQTLNPICYFAPTGNLTISSSTGLTSSGTATVDSTTGEITSVGGAVVDYCSNSTNYSGKTQYYLIIGGQWQNTNRDALKAHLIGTDTGAQMLQWAQWNPQNPPTDWDSLNVWIKPSKMEAAMPSNVCSGDATGATPGYTCSANYVLAPSAQAPVNSVQVLNQRWNSKFDPYCDDVNGNGYCDCYVAGTTTSKDPTTCTLEDDAAEPTLSQPPYQIGGGSGATALQTLFARLGGKAGSQLHCTSGTVAATPTSAAADCADTSHVFSMNWQNSNQAWFDPTQVFQCYYHVGTETTYRSPTQLDWSDFGSAHHGGCPATEGGAATECTSWGTSSDPAVTNMVCTAGGGPVRMVNPVAAKNAYAIERPNAVIKMINYATKTVGQGVTVGPTDASFAFDEALALIALRFQLPALGTPVYQAGTTTADSSHLIPGMIPIFQQVYLNNGGGGGNQLDMSSAVLRGLIHPSELTGQ